MGKAKALRHHYTWREHCKNALVTLISVLVLVLFVYPLVYTVLNSLKTYDDFVSNPQYALPKLLTWENYGETDRDPCQNRILVTHLKTKTFPCGADDQNVDFLIIFL